jgi:hypothetical protein
MGSSRRSVLKTAAGMGGIATAATFVSAGTAAATTTSGVDWLNVKDFGALGDGAKDDFGSIDSALTAAEAAGGGVVYFPAGTYMISSALAPTSGVRLAGAHRDVSQIVSAPLPVSESSPVPVYSPVFDLSGGGHLISGVEIDHLTLTATGADLITGCDLKALYLHDCQLVQTSADHAIWNAPAALLMIECVFERNIESVAGSPRSVAAWLLKGGGVNANTWRDNVCTNAGADDTQYWYQVIASASGGTNEVNTWDNIVFENPLGGMINLQSATRSRIQMCTAWDTTGVIANTLIAIGTYPDAGVCTDTLIVGSPRASSGLAMGTGVYDISVDASTVHTTIMHPTKNALIDLGGSTGAVIIGAPAFLKVSGATTTAVAGAGAGTAAPAPVVTAGADNRSGLVTFGSGTSAVSGTQVKVTFGTPFAVTPTVMITPANGPTAGLLCAVESVSATGFSFVTGAAPTDGEPNTHYGFYWQAAD